ncbi:3-coathanger stack domain-containing protein [Runella sp.]|uniref:3-coathanger stack domain-containing protein n=1 Tax=Runella sp. TaxID=1960881 RepID=UPI003D102C62
MASLKYFLCAVGLLCAGILSAAPTKSPGKHRSVPVATVTWIGGTAGFEHDWNRASNWSTNTVPGSGDNVTIPAVTISNDPALTTNVTIQSLEVQTNGYLSTNGFTLTISGAGTNLSLYCMGTIVNAGTINITATSDALQLDGNADFFNNGTLNVTTTGNYGIKIGGSALLNNGGTINSTGNSGSLFLSGNNTPVEMVKNYGKMNLTNQIEKYSDKLHNYPCGVIYLTAGEVYNNGGQIINEGFFSAPANLNGPAADFINNGILYVDGSASFTNNKIQLNKNPTGTTIFTFAGSNDLTVAGIYSNAAATTLAGGYTQATNTFTHFGLSAGSQTLYAKITRPGGACSQIVPFTFEVENTSAFTTHPTGQTLCPGSSAVFTVAIAGASGYQWQLNTGGGWNNVPATSPYSTTATPTLTISNVTGLNGYQYRCVATGAGGASVTSNAATLTVSAGGGSSPTGILTWTGAVDTDWNTPCNWSPSSVPRATNDVVIPNTTNKPTINTAAVAQSVEVQMGAMLTIAATKSVTVNGSRTVASLHAGFHNAGTVHNNGQLILGNVSSVGEYGLFSTGTFNNNTGAEITIDRATSRGLSNGLGGIFTNAGKITIGATASVGENGIFNNAAFNNNAGGEININNSRNSGLYNFSGTFTNAATITIGATASVGKSGVYNSTTFNNTGGEIKIDRSTSFGLSNDFGGTFNNNATITIGATASVGLYGIYNSSTFNNTGGVIQIDNSTTTGLVNSYGTFTNAATITIGANAGVGLYGLYNSSTFNNTGGEIKIDRSMNVGLSNGNNLTNAAKITIGATASVGTYGLTNDGTINNNACGKLIMASGIAQNNASGTMINAGLVQVANNLKNDGTFTNNGVLKYGSLTGSVTNGTNPSLIVNNSPTPIFTYGGTYDGVINGIFKDSLATLSAGTFTAPNTFTPSGLPGGSQTLYAKITPAGGACSYVVPFRFVIAQGVYTWTGALSKEWNTPGNWLLEGSIPTVAPTFGSTLGNHTLIPVVANGNYPEVSAASGARSVTIAANASLTVKSTGNLKIVGSDLDGVTNAGTFTNNGTVLIDSSYNDGFANQTGASLINTNALSIQKGTGNRLENYGSINNSGTFTVGGGLATAILNHPAATLTNTSTFEVSGGLTGGILNQGTVDNSGQMTFRGGVSETLFINQETVKNRPGANMTVSGHKLLLFDNQKLVENEGNFNVTNGGDRGFDNRSGATLRNKAGAVFKVSNTEKRIFTNSGYIENYHTFSIKDSKDSCLYNTATGEILNQGSWEIAGSSQILFYNLGKFTQGSTLLSLTGTGKAGLVNAGTFLSSTGCIIGGSALGGSHILNTSTGLFENNCTISFAGAGSPFIKNQGRYTHLSGNINANGINLFFENENYAHINVPMVAGSMNKLFINSDTLILGPQASITSTSGGNGISITNTSTGYVHSEADFAIIYSTIIDNAGKMVLGSQSAISGVDMDTPIINTGNLTNEGSLNFTRFGGYGIDNSGTFSNKGRFETANSDKSIHNNGGTIENSGVMEIDSVFRDAVLQEGSGSSFTNTGTGQINVDFVFGNGINNTAGSFVNNGEIMIAQTDTVALSGINNAGTFQNNKLMRIGGVGKIKQHGIYNTGTLTNTTNSRIILQSAEGSGITNQGGAVTNQACAYIESTPVILNAAGTFSNAGIITKHSDNLMAVSTISSNTGTIVNEDADAFTVTGTNSGVSLGATSIAYNGSPYGNTGTASVTLTGAVGGVFSATPSGLSLNTSTGAVDLAASAPQSYTVTYTVMAAGGGCPAVTDTANLVVVAPTPGKLYVWTGAVNNQWHTTGNWLVDGSVPTTLPAFGSTLGNPVQIPVVGNGRYPEVTTAAGARSLSIAANASLTVKSTGNLKAVGSDTDGVTNAGTFTNNGTVLIDSSYNDGFVNQTGASLINTNVLTIQRGTGNRLENYGSLNNSGTFTVGGGLATAILNHPAATLTNTSTFEVSGGLTGGILNQGTVDNSGQMTFSGGVSETLFINQETVKNRPGATMTIRNHGSLLFDNQKLVENEGTFTIKDGFERGAINRQGATIRNKAGGTLSVSAIYRAIFRNGGLLENYHIVSFSGSPDTCFYNLPTGEVKNEASFSLSSAGSSNNNGEMINLGKFTHGSVGALSFNGVGSVGFKNGGIFLSSVGCVITYTSSTDLLLNLPNAVFENKCATTFNSSRNPIVNQGRYTHTAGSFTVANMNIVLQNSGYAEINVPFIQTGQMGQYFVNSDTLILGPQTVVNTNNPPSHGTPLTNTSTGYVHSEADINIIGTTTIIDNAGKMILGSQSSISGVDMDTPIINTGNLTNEGSLHLTRFGGYSIDNSGIFSNKGSFETRNSGKSIYNNGGTFENSGTITIDSVFLHAVLQEGSGSGFTNTATGKINIDFVFGNGVNNTAGNFINNGELLIAQTDTIALLGIHNAGTFRNNHLLRIGGKGNIRLNAITNTGNFANAGSGQMYLKSTAGFGFYNQGGSMENCGSVESVPAIVNASGTFVNSGTILKKEDGITQVSNISNNVGTITNQDADAFNAPTSAVVTNTTNAGPMCVSATRALTATPTGGVFSVIGAGTINAGILTATGVGTLKVIYTYSSLGGCTFTDTVAINVTTLSVPTATLTQPTCSVSTGTAVVNATGSGSLEYSKDGTNWVSSSTFSGLAPGNYTFSVRLQSSPTCVSTSTQQTINAVVSPSASIGYAGNPYTNTGTASVSLTGSAGGVFNSTTGLSIHAGSGEINLALSTPGNYTVTYTIAANGSCAQFQTTASVQINSSVRVVYVNAGNTAPAQDGSSWAKAFAGLQAGLSAASVSVGQDVQIWVAQGTYVPGTLRRDVFEIPSGVQVYGGFAGGETRLADRNWNTHKTILSGEIGSTALNDNVNHVVVLSATNAATRLDGFTIEKGFADFVSPTQNTELTEPTILSSGGGILVINKSRGVITNCVITNNRAIAGGGILLQDSSKVSITKSVVWGNEATFGGGIYVLGGSRPELNNVLIVTNKGIGGGMYVNHSEPKLLHCTLSSNQGSNGTAGGIFNSNALTSVKNSIVWGNSSPQSTAGSVVSYSLVEGGHVGTNNVSQNPLFVNATPSGLAPMGGLGDYHLQNCSPAINAGDNAGAPTEDLEGTIRPYALGTAIVDMGVYESQSTGGAGPALLTVSENITGGTVLKSGGRITATNQVSGGTVEYRGGESVTLLPGFGATGAVFQAVIGGCQTNVPTNKIGDTQK